MAGENAGQLALEALADCEEVITQAIASGVLRGDGVFLAQAKARRVLARPKRNCDVGTAEEQDERLLDFCPRFIGGTCMGCELASCGLSECTIAWAQMPCGDKTAGVGTGELQQQEN